MSTCERVAATHTWQRVQMNRRSFHHLPRAARGGAPACALDPGLWIYRQRTAAMLNRYLRLSLEVGRLPSVLGREVFRSSYKRRQNATFEDAVIFVHDVEHCLEELDLFSQEVLVWVVLQGYSQEEASRVLGCARRTISRHLPEALDRLSEILIREQLL
jgi:DNA-directed RNA polymerase specialized sigma24 family protein